MARVGCGCPYRRILAPFCRTVLGISRGKAVRGGILPGVVLSALVAPRQTSARHGPIPQRPDRRGQHAAGIAAAEWSAATIRRPRTSDRRDLGLGAHGVFASIGRRARRLLRDPDFRGRRVDCAGTLVPRSRSADGSNVGGSFFVAGWWIPWLPSAAAWAFCCCEKSRKKPSANSGWWKSAWYPTATNQTSPYAANARGDWPTVSFLIGTKTMPFG